MRFRLTALALVAAMMSTLLSSVLAPPAAAQPAQPKGKPQVAGLTVPVTGSLPNGGTFTGSLTITSLQQQAGQIVADGTLTGTATPAGGQPTQVTQELRNVPVQLGSEQECQILFLDIQPIFLDLLGLQLSLSRVTLDLTAVPGAGNLLGNLLCAVAGLLDQGPSGPLAGLINDLLRLVNQVLDSLGG
jgi:hypothetical protein